jgi:hypothetical protein
MLQNQKPDFACPDEKRGENTGNAGKKRGGEVTIFLHLFVKSL